MNQIMKNLIHYPRKSGSNNFKAEGKDAICKSTTWGGEISFILVSMAYLNLIISQEGVHEG